MAKHAWQGDMHRQMIDLHSKYGKLVRTGPYEISVFDLGAIKAIYTVSLLSIFSPSGDVLRRAHPELLLGLGTNFRKSEWYDVFQGHRKIDLFAERDEGNHASQRRLVDRIYAMDSLKDLEKCIQDAVTHFISKLHEMQGTKFDLGVWLQLFAFGRHLSLLPSRP